MLMSDLIAKKRDGHELSTEEIQYMITYYTAGKIPDYQMSAMCMAIVFQGMNEREILDLTLAMMHSGDTVDLSEIEGVKADKHSTGGVGDKTSLVLCPMVAACGIKIAKMSGRGLGHTGGTIDKLESFSGFSTSLSRRKFIENVNRYGIAITGQTGNICPADKLLYALRDVTGTVPSIPLIASSIMSKKLAAGADVIVLDVKCGSGAFMKTEKDAIKLAETMVRIGNMAGRKCSAIITDMDQPLGRAVGNAIEVREAISVLKGDTDNDLFEVCLALGSQMLVSSGTADSYAQARQTLEDAVESGRALDKLADMVEAQGGRREDVYDPSALSRAKLVRDVRIDRSGYVSHIDAERIGLASMHLGGGRATKESVIDLSVGIYLHKKVGDAVSAGDVVAQIHASCEDSADAAAREVLSAYTVRDISIGKSAAVRHIISHLNNRKK